MHDSLLTSSLDFYRTNLLWSKTPLTEFPFSQVEAAFRQFGNLQRIGKIVVSLGDDSNVIKVF